MRMRLFLIALMSVFSFACQISAQAIQPGDIVFSDILDELFLLERDTGVVTDIYDQPNGDAPRPDQVAVVGQFVYGFDFDQLYRFDPTNDRTELIGDFGPLAQSDMVATPTGELALFNNDGLHLVDVNSGRFNTIYDPTVLIARDITLAPDGFYVSDLIQGTGLVTVAGEFNSISDTTFDFVASDLAGNLFATDRISNEIVQIDLESGAETFAVSIDPFTSIFDFEIDANGDFIIIGSLGQEGGPDRGIFSVDGKTGVITELAPELNAFFRGDLTIVRNFSPIPEPNTLAVLAAGSLLLTTRRMRRR